ncbi:hypothetical protein OG204_16415 [Streptomyces sp. NBC_01387]|uniref:hypothetical protein n=1 Tax=Streptomyces sp. NBC_01387 TaxID=2903849 RepID=UPI003248C763
MISHTHVPRLLPWTGPAGKPAYLLGGGAGRISRIADTIERDQLGMADDLLDDAAEALADRTAPGSRSTGRTTIPTTSRRASSSPAAH